MFPTPFLELNGVLDSLVERQQSILGDSYIGTYLQGSFAIGDFDEHSDVDFVVVTNDELTDELVGSLQAMHEQIYKLESPWAQHFEGSYFPWESLRKYDAVGSELWYLDHGAHSMMRSNHCNTLVVRWTTRERGVTLDGPPPKTLMGPIPKDMLRTEIFDVINNWGREILANSDRYRNRFYQGFIVLSYCRMLHDLVRGYPGSKREGAEWAKNALYAEWGDLIDRAWTCRPDPAWQIHQPVNPQDFERTLLFVAYTMKEAANVELARL